MDSSLLSWNMTSKRFLLLIFIIIFLCESLCQSDDGPIVMTRKGYVKGSSLEVMVNGQSRQIFTYLGIPFGQIPSRFSEPEEFPSWKPATKTTTKYGPSCFHSDDEVFPGFPGAEMWNAPNKKSEDCLFLNVWTLSSGYRTSEPMPVMVWIYGGSFFGGTSALKVYNGSYLAASGQVVVVSLNYRLGPLGFMPPLGDETPGNVGLMDQNLALRWVQDNIERFGGDSSKVTLFGESAGAASIGLHSISPLSRNLFHRIILQSASQTTPWAAISKNKSLFRARQLAANLSCPHASVASELELLTCLRSKSAQEIFDASWVTTEIFDFPFVPVYGTRFIPEHPKEMTRKGRHAEVDVLAGYNTNEGFYFALYTIPGFSLNTTSLINKGQYLKGIELSGLQTTELGRSAAEFMYDDWKYPKNPARYRDALDEIIGHFHVTCPVINAIKFHSSIFPSKNVYLFHFAYRVSNNPWPAWMGVMHGYEIELVFGLPFLFPSEYNSEDRRVSKRMVEAWTNFAKHGNPTPDGSNRNQWPTYSTKTQTYIEISSMWDSSRSPTPLAFQCAFWERYLPKLELASSGIDEMKERWIVGFNRWSESMNEWESYKARRSNEQCANEPVY